MNEANNKPIGRPKGIHASTETKRKISEALKRAWAKQKGETK